MKKHFITALLIICTVAVFAYIGVKAPGWFDSTTSTEVRTLRSVNKYAKLTASGDPLPSNAREDVEVTVTFFDGTSEISRSVLEYAADGNWRAYDTDIDGVRSSANIYADGRYYIENSADLVWDEVPAGAIPLGDEVETYVLDDDQIQAYNMASLQLEDELCGTARCSVWESKTLDGEDTLVIRVSKSTRKIHDITGITTGGNFIAIYDYRDVDISAPENARLL